MWPLLALTRFVFAVFFPVACGLRLWSFAFSCACESSVFGPHSQPGLSNVPGYPSLVCWNVGHCMIQLEWRLLFLWSVTIASLAWNCFLKSSIPRLRLLMLRRPCWLDLFLLWMMAFLIRLGIFGWCSGLPPTCMLLIHKVNYFVLLKTVWRGLWACNAKCHLRISGFQCIRGACWNAEPQAPPQMRWVRIFAVTRAPGDFHAHCKINAYTKNCSHQRLLMLNLIKHYFFKLLYGHRCNFKNLYWVSFRW